MEALTTYGMYTQGREWQTTPARLSVVQSTYQPPSSRSRREAGTGCLLAASPPTRGNRGGLMARERSELERRRSELTRSLQGLSNNQADTYRRNSDALALASAGVKHERPEEMVRLGEAELAADAAIRDAQRELRDIDAEIQLSPRPGLGARFGRAARRARATAR